MDHGVQGRGPASGRAARCWAARLGGRARHASGRVTGRVTGAVPRLACPVAAALVLWAAMSTAPAVTTVQPGTLPAQRIRLVTDVAAQRARQGAGPSTGRPAHHAAARPARAGAGAAVGVLSYHSLAGGHFCTGTVVHSPVRDLMVTAAHCVDPAGHLRHFTFAPGYRDGRAPYGVWDPRQVVVSARWAQSADPADDVAFVVMWPSHGRNIGDLVAGEDIGRTAGFGRVRLIGYPDDVQRPVACGNAVSFTGHGLEIVCPGFTAGTSGGAWIGGSTAGTGSVVGVIGGYEEGGVSPSVSYSPVFGSNIIRVYQQAVRGARQLQGRA
jgi:hypothetical protein